METYQKEFIEFALDQGVLKFGEFTLKSGRSSPYFFNAGLFKDGEAMAKLGHFYASALENSTLEYDLLFGPAYKGIPLATATSVSLFRDFNKNIPYVFNRKEKKDHGEGGQLVGSALEGKALIIDDVITAGTAIREVFDIVAPFKDAQISGVLIALDRQEKGSGDFSAIQEVEQDFNVPVVSIIKLEHLLSYLENDESLSKYAEAVSNYRDKYGI